MVRSPLLRKAAFVTAVFLGGSAAGIAVYGPALAVQTHMQSALTALNNARNQLEHGRTRQGRSPRERDRPRQPGDLASPSRHRRRRAVAA